VANRKLQIALCITDLEVGGAERCLAHLATRMDPGRFEPTVYCLGPRPEAKEASCLPALEAAGIEVHCLGARAGKGGSFANPAHGWEIVRVLRRLTRLLRQKPPDLVQTFLFHANIVGRVAARRAGVRRVVSGIRVAERGSRWHLWVERWTDGLVDCHVCVSQAVARFSATETGLPPEKLKVIPNGIDVAAYPAQKAANLDGFGVPPGHDVVVYVGRLQRQKGVRWLVRSAPGWLARLPECDLLLVGDGPQREQLERLCEEMGIAGRVHFAGWRPDVPEILAASRLLVLPSRWEGMPNVVLEAMASRLPVVATQVEGTDELLGPGARTVPFGDSEALAEKIVALVRDPPAAAQLGVVNRARAEKGFSLPAMVSAYEKLWESLAAT
jgi:glycosyltransferase involved in cell wall biosynthesis